MKRVYLGVAIILVLAGQAAAEGLPPTPSRVVAPGTPVGPRWSGFYVGGGLGAGALTQSLSGTAQQLVSKQPTSPHGCMPFYATQLATQVSTQQFSDRITGDVAVFGTVTAGYDQRLSEGWVGGIFADYDLASNASVNLTLPSGTVSAEHSHSVAIGARLGFLVTPSTLLYGTGGYTQAGFDIGGLGSKTFGGYFVGAGIETFIAQSWSIKLEYRYSRLGSETIVDTPSLTADLEPSIHTARLVLSYKLGQ